MPTPPLGVSLFNGVFCASFFRPSSCRYFAEPIFFVHAMGRGGGPAGARRPFMPPSILNSLLGSPHGLLSVDDAKDGHGGDAV